jgi:hypothetical protein
MMYNMFKKGDLVILDTCKDIILSIPSLMRDPDNIDDVLKVDAKGDDCYDGFRYGLYGHLASKVKPKMLQVQDRIKELMKTDPMAAWFYKQRMDANAKNHNSTFVQTNQPIWMGKR